MKHYASFPTEQNPDIPRLQHVFGNESKEVRFDNLGRREIVKDSFIHAWHGYKAHAWMRDELQPLDGGSISTFGGWAAALVDTLDTLWIMDMKGDFEKAVDAVKLLNFSTSETEVLNVFETTTRYLGGLLGAYDISGGGYPILLLKATQLGELLYHAFDTPNRMPVTRWNWSNGISGAQQIASEGTLTAEIGSLTLEFTRLSQLTGDLKYFDAIQRIMDKFEEAQDKTKIPGIWPVVVDAKHMTFEDTGFTLGGMADSLYEYLPKQYLLLGGRSDQMQRMYHEAVNTAMKHIFFRPMTPENADILISGDAHTEESAETGRTVISEPRGQHLGCFTGGMVGIGAKIFNLQHMDMARRLVDGCIWAYDSMPSGIMPEVFDVIACGDDECNWNETKWRNVIQETQQRHIDNGDVQTKWDGPQASDDGRWDQSIESKHLMPGFTDYSDVSYGLRPEAIESVFIQYRLTGDVKLLDAAWRMFRAIEQRTTTDYANAKIADVTMKLSANENKMESFWLAETLKYFYLIFSDPDLVSLDEYVL